MDTGLATRWLDAPNDAGSRPKVSGRVDVEIGDDAQKQEGLSV